MNTMGSCVPSVWGVSVSLSLETPGELFGKRNRVIYRNICSHLF